MKKTCTGLEKDNGWRNRITKKVGDEEDTYRTRKGWRLAKTNHEESRGWRRHVQDRKRMTISGKKRGGRKVGWREYTYRMWKRLRSAKTRRKTGGNNERRVLTHVKYDEGMKRLIVTNPREWCAKDAVLLMKIYTHIMYCTEWAKQVFLEMR